MHETTFADAFTPARATVLGVELLTFSIGHEIILWQRRNPLVIYTPESFKELPLAEKTKALGEAVQICSIKAKEDGKKWGNEVAAMDLDVETDKWQAYRASGSLDLPTVKQPRQSSNTPFHYFGAPELARLINYVTTSHAMLIATHFKGSPLEFPLGLAKILYSTHLECEGAIWVENWQDAENKRQKEAYEKAHPESTFAMGEEAVRESALKWNREHPDTPVPVEP